MSDDLLRTARQFLDELQASETHLRASAVLALPYANVLAAERRSSRRCAELLAAMGRGSLDDVALSLRPPGVRPVPGSQSVDDTTDELLTGRLRETEPTPVSSSWRQPAPALGPADTVGAFAGPPASGYEPFDDGPEGSADDGNDIPSESDEVESQAPPLFEEELEIEPLPDLDDTLQESADDDTDETPVPAPVPAPRETEPPAASLVAFDDVPPSDDEPTLGGSPPRTVEELEAPRSTRSTDARPSTAQAAMKTDFDSYVSYEDVADEDSSETLIADSATARAAERSPEPVPARSAVGAPGRSASFSDVGADALVTVEERSTDLLQESLSDDDIEELELDNSDSFDLMPDVTDDDLASFEDEEVTMVKAAETPAWPNARAATPPAADRAAPSSPAAAVAGAAVQATKPARRPAPPKPVAPAAVAAGGAKTTAGLYGGSAVPTIRDSDEPRPRAAAIQLNAGGQGGKVLGLEEEEEPIEIGAAEDYGADEEEPDLADGFSVTLQAHEEPEYDEEEEEEEEEEEAPPEPEPEPEPEPVGPSPEQLRAMLDRAHAAAQAGDLQGGADLFSDALDLDPDNVEAHVSRGRLYLDLGDYSRAMSDFMVAEDIAPTDPEPQVAIGDLYFARKDYRKAIDYFNAALEHSPNHAMAYCRRGISHYYRKNYQEAVTDLNKAEKLDPDIPNIQTYVSMAKKKVKK